LFTIGYGGRTPDDLIRRLTAAGVRTVADVRLRPDRASLGVYAKAKTPDQGIERLFAGAGIGYRSLPELGNVFLEYANWREHYAAFNHCAGHLLVSRLDGLEPPVCLLCAERRVADCHRLLIAEFLATRGLEIEHLE
ncbi:MAG: DUF488 domain-containing protein, partial [Candidatus Solibacter sp.]|nr:DUF488 domain-containing protein [Candidatus Solibacter sp.]